MTASSLPRRDVIVVGLGAMGSHAAWRLAARGVDVLGIDRFEPGHVHGSSHGSSRVFRVACLEHPSLVTIARRSRDLWLGLEAETGEHIIDLSGCLTIGSPQSRAIAGALDAARTHGVAVEQVAHADLGRYTTGHEAVPADHVGLWDPEAGLVHPENAVIAAVAAAERAGADILTDVRVRAIELVEDGVIVRTSTGGWHAGQVVVTAGAWLGKLVPGLDLRPLRVPMTWFRPQPGADFDLSRFPVFIRELEDGTAFWGHGSYPGSDVKIGMDADPHFSWTDPDTIDRTVSPLDWQLVSDTVAAKLPGLDPLPTKATTCMVTHSRDGQFVIGRPGGDARLLVGGGDSGHAFKHAAGIGELLAQLATGETPYVDPDFVDPDRFDLDRSTPAVPLAG